MLVHRIVAAALLSIFSGPAAHAEINLVQTPAPCGTLQDVQDLLNLATPRIIGKGGNSLGEDLVVLLKGPSGYWALIARMSPTKVCVLASGRNWKTIEPGGPKAY
jgi:hypothetical protein